MIEEIRISSLGVIEESVLELGPGLNVVTGETGAGKTMLVTALGLLLGARADSGSVRTGSRAARVDGVVQAGPDVQRQVEDLGGEIEDGALLLARQVSAEGRSRAFLGGAAVPMSALQAMADRLVAVHGQSDQHRLLHTDAQRLALDAYAGETVLALRAEFADQVRQLKETEAELAEVLGAARERAREADLLRLGLAEIEAVDPEPGEDVRLAEEEARLGFADTLRTAADAAREALSTDGDAVDDPAGDALTRVSAARRALDSVREHDPEAASLADRVAELSFMLVDVAADVASYATGLETDPARLGLVSERRAALTGLIRKYGETIDEVLAWARDSSSRLLDLDNSEERIPVLRERRESVREQLADLGTRLSTRRLEAAEKLGAAISDELTSLAMPHAKVEFQLSRAEDENGLDVGGQRCRFTTHGIDQVDLLLAANTGAELRPLNKGASGGELSRVMLAIEVVLAGSSPVPTLVFDEVDAGVGGKAAVEVGRRLGLLARSAQVLVVTHLPQVAAFADRHVVVHKESDGSVTTSGLTVLDDDGRVRELSRMLAGLESSETAIAHAGELLEMAQAARRSGRGVAFLIGLNPVEM